MYIHLCCCIPPILSRLISSHHITSGILLDPTGLDWTGESSRTVGPVSILDLAEGYMLRPIGCV